MMVFDKIKDWFGSFRRKKPMGINEKMDAILQELYNANSPLDEFSLIRRIKTKHPELSDGFNEEFSDLINSLKEDGYIKYKALDLITGNPYIEPVGSISFQIKTVIYEIRYAGKYFIEKNIGYSRLEYLATQKKKIDKHQRYLSFLGTGVSIIGILGQFFQSSVNDKILVWIALLSMVLWLLMLSLTIRHKE